MGMPFPKRCVLSNLLILREHLMQLIGENGIHDFNIFPSFSMKSSILLCGVELLDFSSNKLLIHVFCTFSKIFFLSANDLLSNSWVPVVSIANISAVCGS